MQLQHKKTQQAMPCNYLKPPLFGKFSIVSSARVTWGPGEPVCDGAGWWVVLGSWELLDHLEPGEQLAGLWQHVTPYQLRAITTTAHHIKYILPTAPPQPPYSTRLRQKWPPLRKSIRPSWILSPFCMPFPKLFSESL